MHVVVMLRLSLLLTRLLCKQPRLMRPTPRLTPLVVHAALPVMALVQLLLQLAMVLILSASVTVHFCGVGGSVITHGDVAFTGSGLSDG